jgi:hypothetical protein
MRGDRRGCETALFRRARRFGLLIATSSTIPRSKEAMANTLDQTFRGTGVRYSPKAPLILLAFRDNHDEALPVRPGRVIKAWSLPEDERFVVVVVDGQEFHAFTSDVLECCDALPDFPEKRTGLLLTSSTAA